MGGRGASSLSGKFADPGSNTINIGPPERVTWGDLSVQEAAQIYEDYNIQYSWGRFEDDEGAYLYQANYRYYIIPRGFDHFELVNRRRLI